jgi:UDP-N-acetylglucosamine--N-acetylmuramyl-(pentapeptide) pyrophosphoryl-undecaprenol N-acetylglucosamine transferase
VEKKKKIVLAAGCSGGHITPALTIAAQYPDCDAIFFAKDNRLDKDILQAATVHKRIFLSLINVPRKNLAQFPKFFFQFGVAFITSLNTLYRHKPIKIISTGSYIALPVCMAGWLLRIPIELYELNVEPGQAIRWLSKIATTIYVCFVATQKVLPNAIVTP